MYYSNHMFMIQHCFKPHISYQQTCRFLVNLSFGFMLRNVETGEYSYYYPSQDNRLLEICKYSFAIR